VSFCQFLVLKIKLSVQFVKKKEKTLDKNEPKEGHSLFLNCS
jgi:hypothetical protein